MWFKATGSLEKHFKWFYTDYTYTETFSMTVFDQIFPVSPDRFVSADTVSYWFTGQPDLAENMSGAEQKEMLDGIESKISKWLNANIFSKIYTHIATEYYDNIENPPVGKEQFLANQDAIIMLPAVSNMDLVQFSTTEKVDKILKDYYHTDAFSSLFKEENVRNDMSADQTSKSYQYLLAMKHQYNLVMPGRVIDSGIGVLSLTSGLLS